MKLRSVFFACLLLILGPCTAHSAWQYDATDDYVSIADNAALDLPNGDWAIVIWGQETSRENSARLYARDPFPTTNNAIQIYLGSGGVADEIYVDIRDASGNLFSLTGDATAIQSGNPFTVIVERSGTTVTLYLNGEAQPETITLSTALDTNVAGILGNRSDFARGFRGTIYGFAIYHRALATGEKTAFSEPFSADCNWNNLSVFIPAIHEYVELVNGITLTNSGTTVVANPRMIFCSE